MSQDPAVVYQDRLAAHQDAQRRLDLVDARLSTTRLGVFGLALAAAIVIWRADLSLRAMVLPGIAFLVLIVWHERVIQARHAATRAIAHYERRLARIEDRWIGTGEPGTRFQDEHHPYALDLDLLARTRCSSCSQRRGLMTGKRSSPAGC